MRFLNNWAKWVMTVGAPFMIGILIWQLWGIGPTTYCPDFQIACITKLLDVKENVIIGLLAIFGVTYVAHVIDITGLRFKGSVRGASFEVEDQDKE